MALIYRDMMYTMQAWQHPQASLAKLADTSRQGVVPNHDFALRDGLHRWVPPEIDTSQSQCCHRGP